MITGKNWMRALKDETPLCSMAIPGAHNAGTMGMMASACCQDGDVYEQFACGVRYFCVRISTNAAGELVVSHGISKGQKLKTTLSLFRKILLEDTDDFFILDLREYYPQKIGPVTVKYKADPAEVSDLLRMYLEPEKYALTDFEDIRDVTLGDVRKQGKRYILINYQKAYEGSVDCPLVFPWNKTIYGSRTEKFVRDCMMMFEAPYYCGDGFFWFQTQRTPNPGTEVGMKTPRRLDREQRPYYGEIIDAIMEDPVRLKKANIIAGDFMTADPARCGRIIELNLYKDYVKEADRTEFAAAFGGEQ